MNELFPPQSVGTWQNHIWVLWGKGEVSLEGGLVEGDGGAGWGRGKRGDVYSLRSSRWGQGGMVRGWEVVSGSCGCIHPKSKKVGIICFST